MMRTFWSFRLKFFLFVQSSWFKMRLKAYFLGFQMHLESYVSDNFSRFYHILIFKCFFQWRTVYKVIKIEIFSKSEGILTCCREFGETVFFRHIFNRFHTMNDSGIIFHIWFHLGLKFLQKKKFLILDDFSKSSGASKYKNPVFCTKFGEMGFFSFPCKISLKSWKNRKNSNFWFSLSLYFSWLTE